MLKFSGKKYALGVFFLFAVSLALLAAQSSAQVAAPGAGSASVSALAGTDETAIQIGPASNDTAGTRKSTGPSSVLVLVRVVLALLAVCAAVYGVVYLMKKSTRVDTSGDKYLKSVASLYLAQNRSVHVITVGNQAFLVGSTEQSVNLISELTDRELIDAMNLASDRSNPLPPGTFASVLSAFMPRKPGAAKEEGGLSVPGVDAGLLSGEDRNGSPGEALASADFLRRQRERLQNSSGNTGAENRGELPR